MFFCFVKIPSAGWTVFGIFLSILLESMTLTKEDLALTVLKGEEIPANDTSYEARKLQEKH